MRSSFRSDSIWRDYACGALVDLGFSDVRLHHDGVLRLRLWGGGVLNPLQFSLVRGRARRVAGQSSVRLWPGFIPLFCWLIVSGFPVGIVALGAGPLYLGGGLLTVLWAPVVLLLRILARRVERVLDAHDDRDMYGELVALARTGLVPQSDLACRYGDEFFPSASRSGVARLAERAIANARRQERLFGGRSDLPALRRCFESLRSKGVWCGFLDEYASDGLAKCDRLHGELYCVVTLDEALDAVEGPGLSVRVAPGLPAPLRGLLLAELRELGLDPEVDDDVVWLPRFRW